MMTASKFDCPHWFKLDRYDGTVRLDFEGWRTQIGTRIFLDGLLAAGRLDEFDQHFAEIKESPFMDIDFGVNYASGKAAYPTTFGVAEAMVDTLTPLAPHRYANCDQMLSDIDQNPFAMYAHLTIDFNASKTKIVTDFNTWLEAAIEKNREQFPRKSSTGITKAVIKSWHDHQILPYHDLWLWHQRQGHKMPSHTMLSIWLFSKTDGGKDKVRDTISKAEFAFQQSTLRQLSLAAE
jgi:hypothetical protein